MNIIMNPMVWLCVGLVLMVAEVIIPGGIVFFLGAGCAVVAGAIWLGIVTTWTAAFTLYFIATLVLILALRSFFMRFVEGDSSVANTVELLDEVGEIATVVDAIGPGNKAGRIQLRDTQWAALSDGHEFEVGTQVRIVTRENVSYVVEHL